MQVIYPCCGGLDIHKKFVVACVLTTADDGRVRKATRFEGDLVNQASFSASLI